MREIKFKALAPVLKGRDEGKLKWFEGVLTGDGAVYIVTKNMGIQLLKDVKALCQYTGRKAIQGNIEVYKNDIVHAVIEYVAGAISQEIKTKEVIAIVDWNDQGWWYLKILDDPYLKEVGFYAVKTIKKVLGNVYEHKHLLEDKNEE